jgi:hypothetical protein
MTKHIHANEIHAFAEGAEIQFLVAASGEWMDDPIPSFLPEIKYRVKPRAVKREGWVAVYSYHNEGGAFLKHAIYISEDAAKEANSGAVDVIKIEWEEEE